MFQIDLKSRKVIYEQIVDNFKRLIMTGALKENDRVPSVREMAKTLTVNPNTIQKAYRELESKGYFYTVHGQGSFISVPEKDNNAKEKNLIYDQLQDLVYQLKFFGEDKQNIIDFIENQFTQNQ